MEQTFGSFVREKRQSIGLSLRTLAAKLDLSPVYLSNIENDRRPAPTRAYLERLEQELHLSKVETEQMLDLAAKSQNNRVSADLPDYIMDREIVRARAPHGEGGRRHRSGVAGIYRPDHPAREEIQRGR